MVQVVFAVAAVWGEVLEAGGLKAGDELESQECGSGEVIRARGKAILLRSLPSSAVPS